MIPYTLTDDERRSIHDYIMIVRAQHAALLEAQFPGYKINARNRYVIEDSSEVQFFDILCECLLHKDNNGYLELNAFTYQVNCFAKSIYHRRQWAGSTQPFLNFVWDNWTTDSDFNQLMGLAQSIFDRCTTLLDYHKEFIYDSSYEFVTVTEMRELFDALVESGIFLGKHNSLYQVYANTNIASADTNTKYNYYAGKVSRMDELYLRSTFNTKTRPALLKLDTKFNFIPKHDPESTFDGIWSQVKLGNSVYFVPQFLLFYN